MDHSICNNTNMSSIHSFLQVTINSTKLTQLLEDITISIQNQNKKIDHFQLQFKKTFQFLQNKIKMASSHSFQSTQKLKSIFSIHHQEAILYSRSIDRHLQQYKKQNQIKIQLLNQKISKNAQTCTQNNTQLLENAKKQVNQQKEYIKNWENQFTSKFSNMIQKVQNFGQSTNQQFEKLKDLLMGNMMKVKQQLQLQKANKQLFFINNQKFPQKKNHIDQNKVVKYAAISAKINQLQLKMKQKQNAPLNKILFVSNNNSPRKSSILDINQDLLTDQIGLIISQKLKSIQNFISNKIKFILKDEELLKNKFLVFQQRFAIFGRKFDKQNELQKQLRNRIKIIQQTRIDQKLIDNLRNEIDKCIKRAQSLIQTKCNKDIFQKQRIKVSDKLNIIHENILQKADKNQIKRALLFLQDKIKDIIILIANQQNQQRDGAMTKLPLKCLSCDKDVENKMTLMLSPNSQCKSRSPSLHPQNSMRVMSSRIKRRIRVTHAHSANLNI